MTESCICNCQSKLEKFPGPARPELSRPVCRLNPVILTFCFVTLTAVSVEESFKMKRTRYTVPSAWEAGNSPAVDTATSNSTKTTMTLAYFNFRFIQSTSRPTAISLYYSAEYSDTVGDVQREPIAMGTRQSASCRIAIAEIAETVTL